jgi:hypothetical protein
MSFHRFDSSDATLQTVRRAAKHLTNALRGISDRLRGILADLHDTQSDSNASHILFRNGSGTASTGGAQAFRFRNKPLPFFRKGRLIFR